MSTATNTKFNSPVWFFTNSKTMQIYTAGLGNRPAKTYTYKDNTEFLSAIERFKNDGYDFIKDQGI